MFSKNLLSSSGEVCAFRLGSVPSFVRARSSPGRLEIGRVGLGDSTSMGSLGSADKKHVSTLLLGPESYAFGLVPSPAKMDDPKLLREAVKWTFAKECEIDLANAVCDYLHIKGSDDAGALLKDSHWVFAVDRALLALELRLCTEMKLKISVVDTIATAQRNLCFSEIRSSGAQDRCYASIVLGDSYSSLNISSLSGDLLFHKQIEWSSASLASQESRERLVVDLQRNLGYFERRLASFAVAKGFIYGNGSRDVSLYLSDNLGAFGWEPGAYPEVVFPDGLEANHVKGDDALLIGSLLRWT